MCVNHVEATDCLLCIMYSIYSLVVQHYCHYVLICEAFLCRFDWYYNCPSSAIHATPSALHMCDVVETHWLKSQAACTVS